MRDAFQRIFDRAMKLSESDRFELAHLLLASLPDAEFAEPIHDPELISELDRRWADKQSTVTYEQLLKMQRKRSRS